MSSRALYNCIIFLNQLKLQRMPDDGTKEKSTSNDINNSHTNLPASLIATYFRLFEVAVKELKASGSDVSRDVGMKSRLLSALLTGVNRAHPYLPVKDQKMDEHIDTLYRVAHTSPPATSTQALLLLFHMVVGCQQKSIGSHEKGTVAFSPEEVARQERFYRALYSKLSNPALLSHGKHITMFFNLVYKAMKNDNSPSRVIAFAKRILCTAIHSGAPSLAACIFLVDETASSKPELRNYMEDIADADAAHAVLDPSKREPRAALIVKDQVKVARKADDSIGVRAASWELSLASHHYHPSVSKFASSAGNIEYTGDPLKDFSLAPFLDKLAYRNPKQHFAQRNKRGESVAERRSFPVGSIESRMSLPVNDPAFLTKRDVDVQDEFFKRFFLERARRDEIKGISRPNKDGEDEDDVIDDVEAAAFDQSVSTMHPVEYNVVLALVCWAS